MQKKASNLNLIKASAAKKDEFYTQLSDIEKELRHYTKHFKKKTVLCNCDDPKVSNFFHYFSHNFEKLGLKRLVTTCYKNCDADLFSHHTAESGIYLEYDGDKDNNRVPDPDEIGIHKLKGDGDFRSEECVKLLKQADIVVTNPPFSLFREYIGQLVKYQKKFLIIGNINAISYKDVFKLIKENRIWLGASIHSGDREFGVPDHYPLTAAGFRVDSAGRKFIRVKGVRWLTNMDYDERHEEMVLFNQYNPAKYPSYDNYDAIEVSKTADIPIDYDGAMGVPVTFLDKYNPDQFEILGITDRDNNSGLKIKTYTLEDVNNPGDLNRRGVIRTGSTYRPTYARLLIRRKS
ncbi:MAG TPA: adenine-specific methyltransferase EcoRI family protein [Chitinivibrionales bacterium]|nr:adenine-specific methyltransferase EcoRI family protein [Chitinivibrionales bacterium]